MKTLKSYIGDILVGKKVHFCCNCVMNIDVVGVVKGWKITSNEIIWEVEVDNEKTIKIGENHPNMNIEVL